MKAFRRRSCLCGFSRIELVVGVVVLAGVVAALSWVLGGGGSFSRSDGYFGGRRWSQLNEGRRIYLALRAYAEDTANGGAFPAGRGTGDQRELFGDSNDALAVLMPKYLDDKRVFFNRQSAYCFNTAKVEKTKDELRRGECDWAYVRGLTTSSNPMWPILANAFARGTTSYVTDPNQEGGVYRGVNAVVIWASGSGEVVETKQGANGSYFVKRADKPAANAFEKDGDWLTGDEVKVLLPK